jgi:alpha-tubulin suppressor-like RCC1 family protein
MKREPIAAHFEPSATLYSILRRPQQVAGLTNVVAVSAGRLYALALTAEGKVYAWGFNYYGQLGRGPSGNGTDTWHPAQAYYRIAVCLAP